MATPETRQRPNILITGSPGTGKTTLAAQVAEKLGYDFINVSEEVKNHRLYSEFDEEYQSHVLDEDKLLDHIEDRMNSDHGGVVVEYHGCDFFPERWFDFVIVLRCDNTLLYDRLAARGYPDRKIRENIECEIFGSLTEEARESYPAERIHELVSETVEQMDSNVDQIYQMASGWKK
ncbi:unnamed protein product, partial [Mesorhabditis belari]|uniref:Adenylate kinase isoenzyme 6 homolog n=1 Tax=Mesorhabditis belari TaxID=2138241 RepID=A0AAF3F2G2_9BILA